MRTHFIDPDFRNESKARRRCCVCGRALRGKVIEVRLDPDGCHSVVHPEDATDENSISAFVGPDCAKSIPSEFYW